MADFLHSPEWLELRAEAIARDGGTCTVGALLGGTCSKRLHAHHIVARRVRPDLALDLRNVGTVCARHHPVWENVRVMLAGRRHRRCRHQHRSLEARRVCEARLNRRLAA